MGCITLFPESSRVDKQEDASRRPLKTVLPKSLFRWLLRNFNVHNDLKTKGTISNGRCFGEIFQIKSEIGQEWSLKCEKMYLPEERNETSFRTKELELLSQKLDVLMEKCWILCICILLLHSEEQTPSTKLAESLQWRNSSDVNVSLFWVRSLHNPWTCYLVNCEQWNQQWNRSI